MLLQLLRKKEKERVSYDLLGAMLTSMYRELQQVPCIHLFSPFEGEIV